MTRKLTDALLTQVIEDIRRWNAEGVPGTPRAAAKYGVQKRTVEGWLQKAYDRGLADRPRPGTSLGWHRTRCQACDGSGYLPTQAAKGPE